MKIVHIGDVIQHTPNLHPCLKNESKYRRGILQTSTCICYEWITVRAHVGKNLGIASTGWKMAAMMDFVKNTKIVVL